MYFEIEEVTHCNVIIISKTQYSFYNSMNCNIIARHLKIQISGTIYDSALPNPNNLYLDKKYKWFWISIQNKTAVELIFKKKLPFVQLLPVHPALQVHSPSVCRHILQLGEQDWEQSLP